MLKPHRIGIARRIPHIYWSCILWLASKQSVVLSPEEEFFRDTSRRWIFNEPDRLNERYVKFQPAELQRIAGQVLQQDFCPEIIKLAEGGFNKVFHLRTKSGREVATIEFLRTVLKLPVPEILDYSATSDNPVGAEYILMERVEGKSLASRWLSLTTDDVKHVMSQYKRDLDGRTQIPVVDEFVIGPVSARQFWHGERSRMEIDRGSWLSTVDCITSAARREIAVIQQHAKPQPRHTFLLPTKHDIHPSEHISLLSGFLELSPHLVKPGPFSTPTLRHPDLSLSNIFLALGASDIVSIIDWQDAVIFPRFMQAGYPAFCEHDFSKLQSLNIPSLPDDFDDMSLEEQRRPINIFRLEEANLYYTAATGVHNEQHMDVLRRPYLGMQQYLLKQTGYPWDADVINLRAALVGITTPSVWSKISSAPCPVEFSDQEREAALAESQEWNESEQLLARVREHLGIDLEGGTEAENFERAVEGNRRFRLEMVRQAEPGQEDICWRNWPYKDDGDNSEPPSLVER
ncbi:hypothetical protein BJX66DRAFT_328911 [Aspergillus keveii]|uniref:Mitochondria protein Fmp29 n=1 Tax=Aspergillus keveii TaxID=714993 RepID=A0ABR4FRS3_9EURO